MTELVDSLVNNLSKLRVEGREEDNPATAGSKPQRKRPKKPKGVKPTTDTAAVKPTTDSAGATPPTPTPTPQTTKQNAGQGVKTRGMTARAAGQAKIENTARDVVPANVPVTPKPGSRRSSAASSGGNMSGPLRMNKATIARVLGHHLPLERSARLGRATTHENTAVGTVVGSGHDGRRRVQADMRERRVA